MNISKEHLIHLNILEVEIVHMILDVVARLGSSVVVYSKLRVKNDSGRGVLSVGSSNFY